MPSQDLLLLWRPQVYRWFTSASFPIGPTTWPTGILGLEEAIFLQTLGARQTAACSVSSGRGKARVGALLHNRSRTVAGVNKPVSCK